MWGRLLWGSAAAQTANKKQTGRERQTKRREGGAEVMRKAGMKSGEVYIGT